MLWKCKETVLPKYYCNRPKLTNTRFTHLRMFATLVNTLGLRVASQESMFSPNDVIPQIMSRAGFPEAMLDPGTNAANSGPPLSPIEMQSSHQ